MVSDGSGDGVPPGRGVLREHAQDSGAARQRGGDLHPSTLADWLIEEVDVVMELSYIATVEDKEPNMDEEECGWHIVAPGKTGEAKAKRNEEVGDINELLELLSDSMKELGGQEEPTDDKDGSRGVLPTGGEDTPSGRSSGTAYCPTCGRHCEPRNGATTRPMDTSLTLDLDWSRKELTQSGKPGPLEQNTSMTDTTPAAPTVKEQVCPM